jgi:Flp pilus assembly protein TadG
MRQRDERGEATTEAVLVVPVLILLIFTVIQFGLWYHASAVARAAAQEGVRQSRVAGGTADTGRTATEAFLVQTANSLLRDRTVASVRDANTTEVTVNGTVSAVVPFLHLPVKGHASADTERFRAPS